MNLTTNALGLAIVLLLPGYVCPQDHTLTTYGSHDTRLPDLISPNAWPPSLPRTAGRPTVSMGPTISVDEMRVPVAARKELRLFQRSFQSDNIQDSAKHLERALQIYPQNALAHQYLGVCYFRLHQYDKAVTEFQSASTLDEHLIQSAVSLSVVFLLQAKYPEAEAAARRALEVNGTIPEARYLLGAVLAAQGRDTTETTELVLESSALPGGAPGPRRTLAQAQFQGRSSSRVAPIFEMVWAAAPGPTWGGVPGGKADPVPGKFCVQLGVTASSRLFASHVVKP